MVVSQAVVLVIADINPFRCADNSLQLHSSPDACDNVFRLIANTHSGDRNMTELFVADTRVETVLLTSGWWILKQIEHRRSESG